MITALIFYACLSAACFYLGSRALITKRLWTLYPIELARFMDCAACTGFWWGFLWSAVVPLEVFLPTDPSLFPTGAGTSFIVGLCMVVLTPIAAGLMQAGLDQLGVAVEPPDDAT